jgi:hypothetical protein
LSSIASSLDAKVRATSAFPAGVIVKVTAGAGWAKSAVPNSTRDTGAFAPYGTNTGAAPSQGTPSIVSSVESTRKLPGVGVVMLEEFDAATTSSG